ncbi:MAG: DUF1820 family protein, partial [Gammaproteobacteria bacterium]
ESDMYGFIVVEEITFGERSSVLVDPSEEKIKHEFNDVTRTYIPMHAILRIDEVEKEGIATIVRDNNNLNNVSPFPGIPGNKVSSFPQE